MLKNVFGVFGGSYIQERLKLTVLRHYPVENMATLLCDYPSACRFPYMVL